MKEQSTIKLVQAFVISRIIYVTPYLNLKKDEKEKINSMIKRAYKRAIGLPISTPNDRFDALGLHNSIDELIEAQQIAQFERLSKTTTRRHILRELCIAYGSTQEEAVTIPSVLREQLRTTPLPLNMDPTNNKNRRTARVQALTKQYGDNPEAV